MSITVLLRLSDEQKQHYHEAEQQVSGHCACSASQVCILMLCNWHSHLRECLSEFATATYLELRQNHDYPLRSHPAQSVQPFRQFIARQCSLELRQAVHIPRQKDDQDKAQRQSLTINQIQSMHGKAFLQAEQLAIILHHSVSDDY